MRITRSRHAKLETIHPDPAASFAVKRFETSQFPFHWHYHPEVELTWIVKGSGLRFIGDSIESFSPGDLVLIGPNVPHTWQSPDRGGSWVESVVIQFPRNLWGETMESLAEFAVIRKLLDAASRGLQVVDPNVRDDVTAAMDSVITSPPGSVGRLMGLLRALRTLGEACAERNSTIRAISEHSHDETKSDGAGAKRLKRVQQYLNDAIHAGRPLTQADTAAAVDMSPASFSRFFHQQVGRTFVRYVSEWRVGLACRALVQSDSSITEIAFDSGFENLSNFNRRFKEVKGMTPRAFRRLRLSGPAA